MSCNLWIFSLEVPDQTVDKKNSLLNTVYNTSLENKCQPYLIDIRRIKERRTERRHVKFESSMTPRSSAEDTGVKS